MGSSVIGPLRGVVHAFESQTFQDERSSFKLVANVTDKDQIAAIKSAIEDACRSKSITYTQLERPPVEKAADSAVETVVDGLVVHCRYRLDANHLSLLPTTRGTISSNPTGTANTRKK